MSMATMTQDKVGFISHIEMTIAPNNVEHRDGVLAFAKVTFFGCLVVRDIKLLIREHGFITVAMPGRKISDHCQCGCKVTVMDNFCHSCGRRLEPKTDIPKKFIDISYLNERDSRDKLENALIEEYNRLVPREKQIP